MGKKVFGLELGQLEDMINEIMFQTGIEDAKELYRLLISGEIFFSLDESKFQEVEGVIFVKVVSDGTTGRQWMDRFQKKGIHVKNSARKILLSESFQPTQGIIHCLVILKGDLFDGGDRRTSEICQITKDGSLEIPNLEVACLLREKLSDQDLENMGLWEIVVMHHPVVDEFGVSRVLGISRHVNGPWLEAEASDPNKKWDKDVGFAFISCKGN